MKKHIGILIAILGVFGTSWVLTKHYTVENPSPAPSPSQSAVVVATPTPSPTPQFFCDESLWTHVYHGRFESAQDRLKVLAPCMWVTGTIVNAKAEKDGDFHVRVKLDPQFDKLLNDKNVSDQHGYLVVEPVCENFIQQKDTIAEHVCNNFKQRLFIKEGSHVRIVGAYVTDMEHGWAEIHPVTSITIIP